MIAEFIRRLAYYFRRRRFDEELDEEMRHHLALKQQDSETASGARRQFGNVTLLKERSRSMWTLKFVEQIMQDLRYAVRAVRRNKAFTILAALSLALGIGANTAIFGLIDHVMLRFLPVQNPEELLAIRRNVSYPNFEEVRKRNRVLSSMFGVHAMPDMEVKNRGRAAGELVSGNYFQTLGVSAAIGRTLLTEDDLTPESSPIAADTP